MRLDDNTALSYASAIAQDLKLPLLYLHLFSIGDYKSHDRSPRRIDFQLRQLAYLRKRLHDLDIPLLTITQESRRKDVPRVLCEKLEEWGAAGLYANIEYEVDELRRDTEILERTREAREKGEGWRGKVEFFKDFCIISPGELTTKVRGGRTSCSGHWLTQRLIRWRALFSSSTARQAVLSLLAVPARLVGEDQLAPRRLRRAAQRARHCQRPCDAQAPGPRPHV